MDFIVLLNVIVLIAFIGVLYALKKKHVKFSTRVFIALGLGILLGAALQFIYGAGAEELTNTVPWYNIIGTGYVKLLQMIAMPLVFISILVAFTKMKVGKNFGKMAALILAILIGTTAISAAIGITTTAIFDLDATQILQGDEELARGEALVERSETLAAASLPQQIIELFPANPFADLTGARSTSTIAVVIFSAFLGFAYLSVARKEQEMAATIKKGIDAIYALIMGVVRIVLRLTPYGILAIMARTVATSDYGAIYNLGKFVIASYVALLVVFIIHLLIITLTGLNPVTYVKKSAETLLFAFTSRTSAGALPLNIQTQTSRLGVPEGIANFSASFGLSIGQNGCAGVYPAMLAVMIAPTVGINPLSPSFIATVIIVVAISSFGVAGVGGGATFAAILVLSALDLPIALAGVLISVEPLIDMGRTALNVSGSMTAGVTTARVTGELDKEVYDTPSSTKQLIDA
ncbi:MULTISPECIES: L-cystine transporter [Bacillales]|uniref:L-cystine uptake protein TcyP n=1 Tax=Lysinibacillus louembei TaxID=1470088 RepID=A0ABZ0RW39_9BACI|nr:MULTISPECIES: L-cystine transporter [Bacillales]MCT6922599.1 L-cystine transporter [Metasolibacillus sp.]MCT6939062.1 L-cystine transporter [Metasolibacillus sp.]WPK11506.1 L-cystine transporter [Lysinibacillus louembei]